MKSFSTAALLSLSAVGALAAPAAQWSGGDQCMSAADAQQVADNYAELIRAYSDTLANEALAVDFVDYSESVNTLINTCPQGGATTLPLLSPTFSNRAAFEAGQGAQPAINFNQLNLEYNCKSVTIRWETTNTAPIANPRPVVGIILIEAVQAAAGATYPWIVQTVYSEFDSGAWLQNLQEAGVCKTVNPSSPPVADPSATPTAGTPVSPTVTPTTVVGPPVSPSAPATTVVGTPVSPSAAWSSSSSEDCSSSSSAAWSSSSSAAWSSTTSSAAWSSSAPAYTASTTTW